MAAPIDDDPVFPYADLTKTNEHFSDGIRQRVDDTGFLLERVNPNNVWEPFSIANAIINPSTGQPYPRFGPYVDLGIVKLSDASIYGRSRPLIPYANGRLIAGIRFVPGEAVSPNSNAMSFNTPNVSTANGSDGIAILFAVGNSWDTTGYQIKSQGVDLSGSPSSNLTEILDCGPLVTLNNNLAGLNFGQPLGARLNNAKVCLGDAILDDGGHIQYISTNGVLGSSKPTFDHSGGTTNDGTAQWTDFGLPDSAQVRAIAEVIEGTNENPPYPARFEWVVPPSNTTAGNPIPDFSAILKDQFGNPYTFTPYFVNIAILGAGTLSSPSAQANQTTGIVTFSGFSIAEPATGYVLRVTLNPALVTDAIFSPPFNVT